MVQGHIYILIAECSHNSKHIYISWYIICFNCLIYKHTVKCSLSWFNAHCKKWLGINLCLHLDSNVPPYQLSTQAGLCIGHASYFAPIRFYIIPSIQMTTVSQVVSIHSYPTSQLIDAISKNVAKPTVKVLPASIHDETSIHQRTPLTQRSLFAWSSLQFKLMILKVKWLNN